MTSSNKYSKQLSNISNIQIKSIDILIQTRAELSKNVKPMGLADSVVYHYTKDATFFGKKQQRLVFTFVQGLNTNPSNLSIFLRDIVARFSKQNSKQKITKGQFLIYDIFNDTDCVVQISIPGNFQIYKMKNMKKQLISNQEIDSMYVSSTLRSMYQKNLPWGKCYNLFGTKDVIAEFKVFLKVFIAVVEKSQIFISEEFQNKSTIKGSHSCSILFEFVKDKCIIRHAIQFIEAEAAIRGGYAEVYPKLLILLAQLYNSDGKYSKSLSIIGTMLNRFQNDPFLLFYQAKYMFKLVAVTEALTIANSIVQYNQFQIWCLAAEMHLELKNYSQTLVCLNHASKIASRAAKQVNKNVEIELVYHQFQRIGKKNLLTNQDQITQRPKLMVASQMPTSIINNVDEKFKSIIQSQYWKLGSGQKIIYNILKVIRYRLDAKKFQQLLENTFNQNKKQYPIITFKSGMSQSMFLQQKSQQPQKSNQKFPQKPEQQLPNFLKDESVQLQQQQEPKGNRNLSIIPQLESVIENSQFEQPVLQPLHPLPVHHKKQLSQSLFKLIKTLLGQPQFFKQELQQNYPKILPIYNKLRLASPLNNFYIEKLFTIFMKVENYKSVVILIAECLDAYERIGVRRIQVLPYWMQKFVWRIIEDKGLKFFNAILEKMEFMDEAVIDAVELGKCWKIKGCNF